MTIRLAAPLQSDSVVDGYGVRTVIWTQGCSHNCPFCQNPSTHDFNGGYEVELKDLFNELDNLKEQDGITLSGGDPMFQVKECLEIAKYAKKIGLNVWCFTGFKYEDLVDMGKKNNDYNEILKYIDVLVDGKFENDKKDLNLLFRGSSNQRLIDVQKSLLTNKIILLPESDGIYEKFKSNKKLYI